MKLVYFLYKIWIGVIFWSTLLLVYPFFKLLLSREKWYPKVFKLKKLWSNTIRILIFCPIKIDGDIAGNLKPYVVVSNHSSYLDTVFMFSVIPDYFLFMGMGELLKWPLFRVFFKKMDIPVNRESIRKSHNAYKRSIEAIQKGECMALYPEGKISSIAPSMLRFKNGAFKMAIETQVPIIPITWRTNYKILGSTESMFRYSLPTTISVKIHEPISTKDMRESDVAGLRDRVAKQIASGFDK